MTIAAATIAERIIAWFASEEGIAAVAASNARIAAFAAELRASQKITQEQLNEPFTI
jgi:hypothetical protein